MTGIETVFTTLLIVSGLVSFPTGAYVYLGRDETVGAKWLILIFIGQALWSLAYALQLIRPQAEWWLFLERFVVTGATVVIAGWFLFVLTYTAYDRRLSSLQLAGLLLPFIGGVLAAWTNQYHGLFWRLDPSPVVLLGAGGHYLRFTAGALYTPWVGYLFLIVIAALLMLGAKYVRSRSLHRGQVGFVFVGILLPLVGNILFSTFNATTLALDVTPVLFTATSILVLVALDRYRMLDSVPISQHALLEQLSEGVIVTDEQSEVLHCNQAATEMFGDDLIGENLDAHLPSDSGIEDLDSVAEREFSTVLNDERRHFDVKRTPYTDHRGVQRGAILVFQDVTERETRTTELARQNEKLDQFARVVSHDLQNPLHVAQGYLDLARQECESDHLDTVETAHERMETLITDLLTLARQGETLETLDELDLTALAKTSWGTVETDHATLVTETEQTIRGDPGRVQQLFENLFLNAIEHGGEDVTVTVGELPDGFYIEDDGTGIPEADRERVFDAGYSTEDSGTGFGLNIVDEIASAHGWTIRATNSTGGGARFEITGVEYVDT